jgi:hypothetical protein
MIISRAWQPEDRKIFATAMYNIYEDQYKFKGVLSKLLCVAPPTITSIIKECDFRYKKDLYFREKVINFENYIKNNNNATI